MNQNGGYRIVMRRAALGVVVAFVLSSCGETVMSTGGGSFPEIGIARQGAKWLARQLDSDGVIPSGSGSGADLSATAQTALALAAVGNQQSLARTAVDYLELHADAYIDSEGTAGPGQLGILILDAAAVGINPGDFGGIDLVSDLLATEQDSGPDTGAFGTEAQIDSEDAGTYDQGIALAALAAAGISQTSQVQAAARWLVDQQCPGGGWTLPDRADNSCNAPGPDAGPDTNSTAMAIQGLAAQDDLSSTSKAKGLQFLQRAQWSDGGWSYSPQTQNTSDFPDPNSTALVIQALIASRVSPTSPQFTRGSDNSVHALLSFRVSSGAGAGAFFYPPGPAAANLIATYQAIPALMGLTISQILPSGADS